MQYEQNSAAAVATCKMAVLRKVDATALLRRRMQAAWSVLLHCARNKNDVAACVCMFHLNRWMDFDGACWGLYTVTDSPKLFLFLVNLCSSNVTDAWTCDVRATPAPLTHSL